MSAIENSSQSGRVGTALLVSSALLELGYLYFRYKLSSAPEFRAYSVIYQELIRSALRALFLAAVLCACWLIKPFPSFLKKPGFNRPVVVLVVLLLAPTLIWQNHNVPGLDAQLVFAATTILVALREELIYRYVLQTWLSQQAFVKKSQLVTVLITSIGFTLMHLGAQPVTHFPFIFVASVLLGYIYHYSGNSISLVIMCHLVVDLFQI